MRAMVLCAGLGTRLRPLTNHWPKPALPFFDGPLIRAALDGLPIDALGINTHHLAEVMETVAQAECERKRWTLTVSHEPREALGTGGGIRGLRDLLQGDDAVVLNGDVLFALNVVETLAQHRAAGADATMVLLPMPEGEKYNPVEVDSDGWVRRIAGVGPGGARLTPWHFSGAHVLSPRAWQYFGTGVEDINRDVYRRLMEAGGRIHARIVRSEAAYWSDVGTPQRYLRTVQDVLYGRAGIFSKRWQPMPSPRADIRVSGPAWFAPTARIGEGVRIGAGVVIGSNVDIGAGAMLNRCVVLDGARVAPGVLLEDCLVGPDGPLSVA
jgi:mannose-1-phosphate guanylyltransferase